MPKVKYVVLAGMHYDVCAPAYEGRTVTTLGCGHECERKFATVEEEQVTCEGCLRYLERVNARKNRARSGAREWARARLV